MVELQESVFRLYIAWHGLAVMVGADTCSVLWQYTYSVHGRWPGGEVVIMALVLL